jgi:transcriptional regulator with XRE-family HTH domain
VARRAGLPASYLSRIETGHVHPTFATVRRVVEALHAGLDEITAPEDLRPKPGTTCPVTAQGHCLLELLRSEIEVARAEGREVYSVREVRMLRNLARFMRKASPERVRAIELLLEELLENTR